MSIHSPHIHRCRRDAVRNWATCVSCGASFSRQHIVLYGWRIVADGERILWSPR